MDQLRDDPQRFAGARTNGKRPPIFTLAASDPHAPLPKARTLHRHFRFEGWVIAVGIQERPRDVQPGVLRHIEGDGVDPAGSPKSSGPGKVPPSQFAGWLQSPLPPEPSHGRGVGGKTGQNGDREGEQCSKAILFQETRLSWSRRSRDHREASLVQASHWSKPEAQQWPGFARIEATPRPYSLAECQSYRNADYAR